MVTNSFFHGFFGGLFVIGFFCYLWIGCIYFPVYTVLALCHENISVNWHSAVVKHIEINMCEISFRLWHSVVIYPWNCGIVWNWHFCNHIFFLVFRKWNWTSHWWMSWKSWLPFYSKLAGMFVLHVGVIHKCIHIVLIIFNILDYLIYTV